MQEPLFIQPVLQEKIWGGTKLRDIYGYDALLVAVFVDEADFCVPNFLVYQELLTGYVGTPP